MSERRLAAIMLIEFVSRDAPEAIELPEEKVSFLKPVIENHSGRLIQDRIGAYASLFDSALDAVDAAREILEESNTDIDYRLRIGIHLGDVVLDGNEIQGVGIDMASKITSAAEPGSVMISEAVLGAVKGTAHIYAQLLKENIIDETGGVVRVYKLVSEGEKVVEGGKSRARYVFSAFLVILAIVLGLWHFTRNDQKDIARTVLILPFELAEADTSNQHVVGWVLSELIRTLGNANSLTVFNQATSKVFIASLLPISDARERLDQADYFVHGSIKVELDKINIVTEIYDREEVKIWSNKYTNELDSLSWVTNEIAIDIIDALKVKLDVREHQRIVELEPIETEQYELQAKAWNELGKWTPEGFANAKVFLKEMRDNNPTSSRCWASYAQGLISMGHSSFPPPGIWTEAKAAAEMALQYDSLNAQAWAAYAHSTTYGEQDFEGAVKAYKRSNELNPNMGWNHYHYAWHLYLYDRLEEAIKEHRIAQEKDPLMPGHTFWLGVLLIRNGDFEQAMLEAERLLRIRNDSLGTFNLIGQIYFEKEQYDSAIYFYEKSKNKRRAAICKYRLGDIDPMMEVIQSIKDQPLNSWYALKLAQLYAEMDSLDKFFEYANFEPPVYSAPYLRKTITNPNVLKDPRFKELMAKFDLPMPKGYE